MQEYKQIRLIISALITSNDEMEEITKIVKSSGLVKDSGLLLKGISETIQNKAK